MFTYRGYLGWITDLASHPHPTGAWPVTEIDDSLLADYGASFAMQQSIGLDISSIWGLAVGRSWPLDIESSVTERRMGQLHRLLDSAHRHDIRVLAGTGVYSWGFDTIIRANPALSAGNPHAMCASNPDAWPWMRRVLDFMGDVVGVDGFSFQSADQGRCPCARCARWNDVEYHARLNARAVAYVKERWPVKLVAINGWGMDFSDSTDLSHIVTMTRHADYVIDPHNSAAWQDPAYRCRLAEAIAPCAYGTVGGPFVEPPQHWERTRWFLPCLERAARHVMELHADGGHAMEVYFHILANPGDEVSVSHTAALLRDPTRSSDEALHEVLDLLYRPHDHTALDRLVSLFRRADAAYFAHARDLPARATISLEPLISDHAGDPIYLTQHFDRRGLEAYEQEITALLGECSALADHVTRRDKVETIVTCLRGAQADVMRAWEQCGG